MRKGGLFEAINHQESPFEHQQTGIKSGTEWKKYEYGETFGKESCEKLMA